MGAVRIRSHVRVDESAAHDIRYMVDERVMNAAVWNMDHAMRAHLKQPELGRAQATADRESSAVAESSGCPGNDLHPRQAVSARQIIQCAVDGGRNARLAEPRTAGAWGPMRAGLQQSTFMRRLPIFALPVILNPLSTGPLSLFSGDESILLDPCGLS